METLDIIQQQVVQPDPIHKGQSQTIAIGMHGSSHEYIGVVLLILNHELLLDDTLMRVHVEYAHGIGLLLYKQYQWFGLAYGHALIIQLPDIRLSDLKIECRFVMPTDLLLTDIIDLRGDKRQIG